MFLWQLFFLIPKSFYLVEYASAVLCCSEWHTNIMLSVIMKLVFFGPNQQIIGNYSHTIQTLKNPGFHASVCIKCWDNPKQNMYLCKGKFKMPSFALFVDLVCICDTETHL